MYEIHPQLPCGFDSSAINLDELNGAGLNWDVMPVRFDTFEALTVLILTEEMLALFDEHPDLVLPCLPDTAVIRPQDAGIMIGDIWSTYFTSLQRPTYKVPGLQRTVHISNKWQAASANAPVSEATLKRGQRTVKVKA